MLSGRFLAGVGGQQAGRRPRQFRHRREAVLRFRRQAFDPPAQQRIEIVRHRKVSARLQSNPLLNCNPRNLQGMQGVAAGEPLQFDQPGKIQPVLEVGMHQRIQTIEVQRAERESCRVHRPQQRLQLHGGCLRDTLRHEQRDRFARASPQGERHRPCRGVIKPLHVVDRHQDRALLRECTHDVQQAEGDCQILDAFGCGRAPVQCHLEGMSPWREEVRQDAVRHLVVRYLAVTARPAAGEPCGKSPVAQQLTQVPPMADAAGGNSHYIASPEDAPAVFAEEFEELAARQAELN